MCIDTSSTGNQGHQARCNETLSLHLEYGSLAEENTLA